MVVLLLPTQVAKRRKAALIHCPAFNDTVLYLSNKLLTVNRSLRTPTLQGPAWQQSTVLAKAAPLKDRQAFWPGAWETAKSGRGKRKCPPRSGSTTETSPGPNDEVFARLSPSARTWWKLSPSCTTLL